MYTLKMAAAGSRVKVGRLKHDARTFRELEIRPTSFALLDAMGLGDVRPGQLYIRGDMFGIFDQLYAEHGTVYDHVSYYNNAGSLTTLSFSTNGFILEEACQSNWEQIRNLTTRITQDKNHGGMVYATTNEEYVLHRSAEKAHGAYSPGNTSPIGVTISIRVFDVEGRLTLHQTKDEYIKYTYDGDTYTEATTGVFCNEPYTRKYDCAGELIEEYRPSTDESVTIRRGKGEIITVETGPKVRTTKSESASSWGGLRVVKTAAVPENEEIVVTIAEYDHNGKIMHHKADGKICIDSVVTDKDEIVTTCVGKWVRTQIELENGGEQYTTTFKGKAPRPKEKVQVYRRKELILTKYGDRIIREVVIDDDGLIMSCVWEEDRYVYHYLDDGRLSAIEHFIYDTLDTLYTLRYTAREPLNITMFKNGLPCFEVYPATAEDNESSPAPPGITDVGVF